MFLRRILFFKVLLLYHLAKLPLEIDIYGATASRLQHHKGTDIPLLKEDTADLRWKNQHSKRNNNIVCLQNYFNILYIVYATHIFRIFDDQFMLQFFLF